MDLYLSYEINDKFQIKVNNTDWGALSIVQIKGNTHVEVTLSFIENVKIDKESLFQLIRCIYDNNSNLNHKLKFNLPYYPDAEKIFTNPHIRILIVFHSKMWNLKL